MTESILEGELLSARPNDGAAPPKLATNKLKKGSRNINVSRTCAEMDYNPAETLVHVAKGDKLALGTDEDIRVFERRAAASELLSYITAKPKEIIEEEQLGVIPEFIPKRGVLLLEDNEETE